ncbi:MAG: hypothetical protein E7440_07385 [Ruminococcaceae bacterium]|nr:hypothetical protein [Oscillospiraceae bacterium]
MEPNKLAEYISIPLPGAWENCYEAAVAQYRADWLDDYDFEAILDYYDFSEDYYKPRLRQEIALLKRDETLNRICWLMHYILFYGDTADFLSIWSWGKGVNNPFAEHGSPTTCVVAALTGQAIHAKNMAERGFDEEQIQIHKAGVQRCWVGQREDYGVDGVSFGLMVWMGYFMRCHLVRLGRLQYECGLKHYGKYDHLFEGEPIYIYIHIPPADNGLQDDEVGASIRLALEKLEQYYPQVAGKTVVFCTNTWLLSPQLREILKPGSNIIKFQDRFNITEFVDGTGAFLNFGFKINAAPGSFDYNTLPEDTYLRREVKARLLRGEPLQQAWGYFTL